MVRPIDMAQQAVEDVKDDHRPGIADVGEVVDGRAADIHAHIVLIDGSEDLLRAGERIVELQFCRHRAKIHNARGRTLIFA